jgi:hypothetical protein
MCFAVPSLWKGGRRKQWYRETALRAYLLAEMSELNFKLKIIYKLYMFPLKKAKARQGTYNTTAHSQNHCCHGN